VAAVQIRTAAADFYGDALSDVAETERLASGVGHEPSLAFTNLTPTADASARHAKRCSELFRGLIERSFGAQAILQVWRNGLAKRGECIAPCMRGEVAHVRPGITAVKRPNR